MAFFLGVDQGSNSSRAVLFDQNGEVVTSAARKVTLVRTGDDRVEYEPTQLLASVNDVIQQVLATLDSQQRKRVSACGIATQRSTLLAWQTSGAAISPALSWQDVRAQTMLLELEPQAQEIMRLTGLPLTPYYSASKMNWLLNHSDAVKQCRPDELRLSPLVSYLLYHLLDSKSCQVDFSNAQRTLLFELDTLTWSQRLCHWFDVDSRLLPECVPIYARYGNLANTEIPVMSVCGDQNAAMVGAGLLGADTALVNIGSGAFVLRELDQLSYSANQLTGIAYADSDAVRYMREATINGAGNALNWAEQQWQIENMADNLPLWLQQVRHPPVFINMVGGLGTPWMQGGLHSEMIGDGDYSDAEKAVAVIESIVFMIQVNLELMNAEATLQQLRLSGGLSNLDGLCQRLSNLSGLVAERATITEATARGAAWIAAGRPENWCIDASVKGAGFKRFMPEKDTALQDRYRLFRAALDNRLEKNQTTGSSQ